MKKLRVCFSVLVMVGILFSAISCVNDEESDAVKKIRDANAKYLDAEAILKQGEAAAFLAADIVIYTSFISEIQAWETENIQHTNDIAEKTLRLTTFSNNYAEAVAAYLLEKNNKIAANNLSISELTSKVAEYKSLRDGDVVAKIQAAEKDKNAKEAEKVSKERTETEAQAALNAVGVVIASHPNKTKAQLDAELLSAQTVLASAKGDLAVEEKMLADTLAAYVRYNTAKEAAQVIYNAAQDKVNELTGKGQTSGSAWDAAQTALTNAAGNLSDAITQLGSYQALYNAQVAVVQGAQYAVEGAQGGVDYIENSILIFNTTCEGKDMAYWIAQRTAAQTALDNASTEVTLAKAAYNVANTKHSELKTLKIYVEADKTSKDATDFFAEAVNAAIATDEETIAGLKKDNEAIQRDIKNVMVNAGDDNGTTGIDKIIALYNKDITDLEGKVAANKEKIAATKTIADAVKAVIEAGLDALLNN